MAICKAIIVLYPPLMHSKFRHRRDILKVKAGVRETTWIAHILFGKQQDYVEVNNVGSRV